ncbi:MAG: aminoglycoside phosphotransferase family protein [Spirochaetales bacterium]
MQKIEHILNSFCTYGDLESYKGFGTGHINNTYVATRNQGGTLVRYTHQRINKNVFKKPDEVMQNIHNATAHIAQKLSQAGKNDVSRRTLLVVPTKDNKLFYIDEEGEYWRTYLFVEKAHTLEVMENAELAYKVGRAVGLFQEQLADYNGPRLFDTIPRFHDMRWRYEQFDEALKNDPKKRAASVQAEIDFMQENRERGMILIDGLQNGKLRECITHNDTKLNNILFDDETGEAICMIDLDTVMPGSLLFDTGDLIRTATNTGAEDEIDLTKVSFDFELFKPLIKGYIEVAGSVLSDYEKSLIPESGRNFAQIMGLRILTDYINGDVYYKIEHETHNIERARTQIKLMQSMDEQWEIVQDFMKNLV